MTRLCLRLLMVTLCLYLAGSVYPLFATVGGHGSTSSPPPAPPPSAPPTPPPSSPAQLGGGSSVPGAPPTLSSGYGGGGCGGGSSGGSGVLATAPPPPPVDEIPPPSGLQEKDAKYDPKTDAHDRQFAQSRDQRIGTERELARRQIYERQKKITQLEAQKFNINPFRGAKKAQEIDDEIEQLKEEIKQIERQRDQRIQNITKQANSQIKNPYYHKPYSGGMGLKPSPPISK
jgi:hypothetical protein